MNNLQELLMAVKASDITFAESQPDFQQNLALVEQADELALLKNVTRTISKRTGDRYGSCIAVTLKDGLSVGGERWLEQHVGEA